MTPAVREILLNGTFVPTQLPSLAAWYDLSKPNSYTIDTGVKLLADLSGNSNVNVLALNGVAGNYASTPDAAGVELINDVDIAGDVAAVDYTSGTSQTIAAKWNATGNQRSYQFFITATGTAKFFMSPDGTGAAVVGWESSAGIGATDLKRISVRFTRDIATGVGRFYTGTTFGTWTQLGSDVAGSTDAIFDSTAIFQIGDRSTAELLTGLVYRVALGSTIGGAYTFDMDFATLAKLAASGPATTGQTVTINTSGDLGARICGARDLVQMTGANQPALTAAALPYITFDGTNDYMKAAAFSLSQPETIYFVGSQVSYTAFDGLFDGNSNETMRVQQWDISGRLALGCQSGKTVLLSGTAIAAGQILSFVASGTSSSVRQNSGSPSTGDAGIGTPNGFTLGAIGTPGNYSNITAQEILVYSASHDQGTQDRVIRYLSRKWQISV